MIDEGVVKSKRRASEMGALNSMAETEHEDRRPIELARILKFSMHF